MEFKAVILTEIGDYLVKDAEDYQWTEKGLEIEKAHVVNEEGLAQRIKADELLVTDNAIQGIQKGSFEEETVE